MYQIMIRPLDRTLIATALEDLLEKVLNQGDFYSVSPDIENLLEVINDAEEIN